MLVIQELEIKHEFLIKSVSHKLFTIRFFFLEIKVFHRKVMECIPSGIFFAKALKYIAPYIFIAFVCYSWYNSIF